MFSKYFQNLARWCLSNDSLIGKVMRGTDLEIIAVERRVVKVSPTNKDDRHIFAYSHSHIVEEFQNIFSKEDMLEFKKLKFAEEKQIAKTANFCNLVNKALSDQIAANVHLAPAAPSSNDDKLAFSWLTDSIKNSDQQRMLSARIAEVAVANFYKAQGNIVEDISITQINKINDGCWKCYDLKIDGFPMDVKNARQSKRNIRRYVGYCVPKFKEDRDQISVAIAGVLSPFLPLAEMWSDKKKLLFMGVTYLEEYKKLQNEFNSSILDINFVETGRQSKNFLPPWIFSYPDRLYGPRDACLAELRKIDYLDWEVCKANGINPLPAYIAAGVRSKPIKTISLPAYQNDFIRLLMPRVRRFGLSLAVVYLSVLEHFLRVLSLGPSSSYSPKTYLSLVFTTGDRTRPLFIYDPLSAIDSLINCLLALWDYKARGLTEFRMFQLQGFNILRGKKNITDPNWTTLIAYCGGWLEMPWGKKPCGNTPLVLGVCKSCDKCGKLVCPSCGFCSESCKKAT